MNLDDGWKKFCIDFNDQEEEEDVEENDEPDFCDENSGKCWEFGSKIVNEKHLKEWCQNKMGGMIVGKEEKLIRQFHCQIKQCQFKAIFLKSCSIVYTRNKHNHGMENARNIQRKKEEKKNQTSTLEQNYVDQYGKLWPLHGHIGKIVTHRLFFTKFGFKSIQKKHKTLYLHCQKRNPTGGRCPFVGIYLKSNGCLYTRGQHEHTNRRNKPQNIGEDYIDHFGKIWKFNKEIGKNVQQEILRNKFGFVTIRTKGSGLILDCRKKAPNGRCKYVGVYLKSNGCLYTRGKHNHPHIEKNPKPNVGYNYVDKLGKIWPFHAEIGKQHIPDEIWHSKFGFSTIQQKLSTLNLYCRKEGVNGGRCPFTGIYIKQNGCLYIRGKHEHKYSG